MQKFYLLILLLASVFCQQSSDYSKAYVSYDFLNKFVNHNFDKIFDSQKILCQIPSNSIKNQRSQIDPTVQITFLKNINLFESNGQVKAEVKNAQVEIQYIYKHQDNKQEYEINHKGSTNILLKINFHHDSDQGLNISIDKEEIKSQFSELTDKSEISSLVSEEFSESNSLVEKCIQDQLPQLAVQVNKMIKKSQETNILNIKEPKMYEKCQLQEIEKNQINFACSYAIFIQETNKLFEIQREESGLQYPKIKVQAGYSYAYSSHFLEKIFNMPKKIGQNEKYLRCDQAKYMVKTIDFDKYFPGLSNKVQNPNDLRCPLKIPNPIILKSEGSYYNARTYNTTASIGPKAAEDDSITEVYAAAETTINMNFQMEISSENVLKIKLMKLNLEELKVKDKDFLPEIQATSNLFLSMFYHNLSNKAFYSGIKTGSEYYNVNNPQTSIQNEFFFLEVKDPKF